jgi:serine/threonine-protein kinase RsbW
MLLTRMENSPASTVASRMVIHARMSEAALLSDWVERIGAAHHLPEATVFAARLCLEELVANTILHGHGGDCDSEITVSFEQLPEGDCRFVMEDHARPFDPAAAPLPPALDSVGEMRVGGQGLRLVREFASRLEHHAQPGGNRVLLTFQLPSSR